MKIKRNYMFTAKETPLHEENTYFVYASSLEEANKLFRQHHPYHIVESIEEVDFFAE